MVWPLSPTIDQNRTTNLAATHGAMSHHVDTSYTSTPMSNKNLKPFRSGSNLVPVVEISVRKPRPTTNTTIDTPLRAPSLPRPQDQHNVASSSTSAHTQIALPRLPSSLSRPVQTEWTLQIVHRKARDRLRPIKCPWTGCDALLASLSIFEKHLERHLVKPQTGSASSGSSSVTKCPWSDCKSFIGLGLVEDLRTHVEYTHVVKLRTSYCPFKSCPHPEVPPHRAGSTNHFAGPGHETPWNSASLRLIPDRKHARSWPRPKKPPPIDPSWNLENYPLLVTVYPHTPDQSPMVSQPKTRYSDDGKPVPPSLKDLPIPISMNRSDEYFRPNGEAPSGWTMRAEAISSSILRHPCFHDPQIAHDYMDEIEVAIERDMKAKESKLAQSEQTNPFDTMFPKPPVEIRKTSPLVPRPRPDRRGLQILSDAEMFNWTLNKKRKREPIDRKGKGRADVMDVDQSDIKPDTTFEPYSRDTVVRASKRLARRNSGWSVGIGHWRERLCFERRGQQLGELPEWHQI